MKMGGVPALIGREKNASFFLSSPYVLWLDGKESPAVRKCMCSNTQRKSATFPQTFILNLV